MKYKITLLSFLLITTTLVAQNVFINEIHYDNVGSDLNEGIEIAGPAGTDLSDYELHFYNGNNGETYLTEVLSGIISDESNGFGTLWFSVAGIQNGAPDGIALYQVSNSSLIQFLSYEGAFSAVNGVATAMYSTDIGVEEVGSAETESLQLIGSGTSYSDFVWSGPTTSSNGNINANQSFGGATGNPIATVNLFDTDKFEDEGMFEFEIVVSNIASADLFGIVLSVNSSSTATENVDFLFQPLSLLVDGYDGSNQSFAVQIGILEDMISEMAESIIIDVSADPGLTVLNNQVEFTIIDNDISYTPVAIADVIDENADGTAASDEMAVELSGIVYGINLRSSGIQFTLINEDNTAGIGVFSFNDFGYTVTEGDNLTLQGEIGQFNGLTQINPDTLIFNSSGNAIEPATNVGDLNESTESLFSNIELQFIPETETTWIGDGSSFNVKFLNLNNDTVEVRIDDNTMMASMSLQDMIDNSCMPSLSSGNNPIISGIGGQFDASNPFTEGYQLLPYDLSHFNGCLVSTENFENSSNILKTNYVIENLELIAQNQNAENYIYGLDGKVMQSFNTQKISVAHLKTGYYFLVQKIDNKVYTQKFFKAN